MEEIVEKLKMDINCLDCDTEILTPGGWIKIANYSGEEIYHIDKTTRCGFFKQPNLYIKERLSEEFIRITGKGIDQVFSPEHTMLCKRNYISYNDGIRSYSSKVVCLTAKEFTNLPITEQGQHRSFVAFGSPGLTVREILKKHKYNISQTNTNELWIRILATFSRDGEWIDRGDYFELYIQTTLEEKSDRCKYLLESVNVPYNIQFLKSDYGMLYRIAITIRKDREDILRFFNLKNYYKLFEEDKDLAEIFMSECFVFGLDKERKKFYTKNENLLDLIQFLRASSSYKSSIFTTSRGSYVSLGSNTSDILASYINCNIEYLDITSGDGFKYCFNTDTGFFLARRNKHIFVTGNCGDRRDNRTHT